MTNNEWLRKRIMDRLDTPVGDKTESLSCLRDSEFEMLMRNRLLVGRFRYGKMNDLEKGQYDCVDSMLKRLRLYEDTGNLEHLVDVANLALVEYVHSRHPKKHFSSSDDGIHCERINQESFE